MQNKKILIIRKKLDSLDNKLLSIIKKRVKLVSIILKNKKFKKQIIDRKRIKQILSRIKKKSKEKNIDAQITQEIWKSMINACIKYEYRNFKK
tara:strand:+ start:352 stop:630 length:279 start_codon:yes stop_codon:yes gene_type:complete